MQVVQIVLWYLDSGCSKHMIGDRSRLKNFVKKFIGTVRFGNDHFGAIIGYGDYVIGDSVISRVYYVEELGHNLFSVGQFCDSDLEVAFRKHTCFIRDLFCFNITAFCSRPYCVLIENDIQAAGFDTRSPMLDRTDNYVFVPHDPMATELKIYKEQVSIYEQRAKFELTEREQQMDDQMRMLIQNRNKMEENLKKELHYVKLQLNSTMENNKIFEETCMTKGAKDTCATVAQNPFHLRQAKKAQPTLYDGKELLKTHHVPVNVPSSEEELKLAETMRNKLHAKMNDSACVEKRSLDLAKRKAEELKANAPPLPVLPPATKVFILDQNEIDLKSGEIERKNLLITNEKLIAECLSKDVFYTATDSVLNVSRFSDMHDAFTIAQKRIADLESENFNLRKQDSNDITDSMIKHLPKLEDKRCLTASGSKPRSNTKKDRTLPRLSCPLVRTTALKSDCMPADPQGTIAPVAYNLASTNQPDPNCNWGSNVMLDYCSLSSKHALIETPYIMTDVDVNAPAELAPTMAPPTRTDDQILPHIRWVPIGKSNCYLDVDRPQSNPIFKIVQWFNLSKDTHRDALQITPVDRNNAFSSPPTPDALIKFVNDLGYPKVGLRDQELQCCRCFEVSSIEPISIIQKECGKNSPNPSIRSLKTKRILLNILRERRLIIHYLQSKHKFHTRPGSPLHLPNEEPVLGYLKFSSKGTKREVFGMPIPNDLVTDDIRGKQYYNAYLEKVAKHQRYLAGEDVSDPDSPAPKPTKGAKPKTTKKPTSTQQTKPKTKPSIAKNTKSTPSQPPKPKPAPANPQEKKRKRALDVAEALSLAKHSKADRVSKKRTLQLRDEFIDEGVPAQNPGLMMKKLSCKRGSGQGQRKGKDNKVKKSKNKPKPTRNGKDKYKREI
ncbi:hypothetical protein Tco_0791301 [Tanacetum coccineum]